MTNETKELIETGDTCFLHTYNRFPVVLDRGEGMYLYDTDGKRYLDFFAGIAVFALGHHYPSFDEVLKDQIDRLIHTSNYFYNKPAVEAAKKLCRASGMARAFFCNSGAEAVEGALKSARKYGFSVSGGSKNKIVAFSHSFHGRSLGALSVTGTKAYREPFEPLIGNVSFAALNDMDSVAAACDENTCAVILEAVQGEGGILVAEDSFLRSLRAFCDEHDILLIFDEIQCGMGRTGEFFAYMHAGIQPDIMTTAKALGNGIPVGAFLVSEKVADLSLSPGDHGTTLGGNPLSCAAASCVLDIFERDHIIDHVRQVSPYLEQALDRIVQSHGTVLERRGRGLMQGLLCAEPVLPVIEKAMEKGLILINAGSHVLRFVPPLITGKEQIDEMVSILETCL